ncbi:MAG: cell wall protein [Nocardioidaceae bacterium]
MPVVLPVVRVDVESRGQLRVALNGEVYDVPEVLARRGRDALRNIVDDITQRLGPVRVEVTEADGTVFTDIATPPDPSRSEPGPTRASIAHRAGVAGVARAGFLPGEEVDVAVIVAHRSAEPDGTARLRLPPALAAARQGRVVLVGRTSRTVAWDDIALGPVDDGAGGAG